MKHLDRIHPHMGVSANEKETAKSLEFLPSLKVKDRTFLMLVWRKLKTATPISISAGSPKAVVNDLERTLAEAGLFFKLGKVSEKERGGLEKGQIYYVANNQKDLDLISTIWTKDLEEPDVVRQLGRMSGFPQTAIHTHLELLKLPKADRENNETSPALSEQQKISLLSFGEERDLLPFALLFHMTKVREIEKVAFLESELQVVRNWAKEIKSTSPSLYAEFITDFNKTNKWGLKINLLK